jgi:hypothetical protein
MPAPLPPDDDADDRAEAHRLAVPTEEDWRSEFWNIDTPYAYEYFHGKDLQEAFRLFVESSISYEEDVMFMPLRCFQF